MTAAPESPGSPVLELLYTTPLGQFCRHPEIALALAQDKLAASVAPFIQVPDLLAYEERLFEDWQLERPEPAAEATASAEALKKECMGMESKALGLRLRLHLAAHRRIDAAALGREVFLPCPAFLGEPHIACELADGLILKIGIVRMAHYWPKPEMAARSRAWCGNRALVEAVERRLFPLLPPPGPDAAHEFEVAAGVWILLQPLREFEARHCLPLFPYSTIYPDNYVPRGYHIRIRPETMRELGGSYLTLASAGLSPYIAEPLLDYCETRRELLETWKRDLLELGIAKWDRPPEP
jgi:hypothetical protein